MCDAVPDCASAASRQRREDPNVKTSHLLSYWKLWPGLLKAGYSGNLRVDMMRATERAGLRVGAIILAAILICCGEARAQSSNPLDFLGNIFSSKNAPAN